MIHKFELCERFFVYDEQSGALSEISQVAFELLEYINSAMESPDVPSAVRYSMAKYDSALVKKEYEKLYALQNEGKLFCPEEYAPEMTTPNPTPCSASETRDFSTRS